MHITVGWIFTGNRKKDEETKESFQLKYCKEMPRTMFRYAIGNFDETKLNFYLKK